MRLMYKSIFNNIVMKKIHLFALLAATSVIALVSCNKEIVTPDVGVDPACPEGYYVEELTAVYPHDPETRTAFNETTGRFAWTEGDELAFHLSNGEYVAAPIDPATGKVKLYLPVGVTRDNYAVYPASSIVDDAAEIGNMKVTIPNTYDISADPNTDYVPTPLVAWNDAENKHLKFEHVGGLLQVNLKVPAGVKTATVSMGKTISGTFSLQDGTGNGIITPGTASDEGITFILSEEGLSEETEVKLLTPLPTGSYEYFEIAYDNGFEFSKDLSATPWNFSRSGGKKVSIAKDKFEDPNDYFWFEALEPGSTVKFTKNGAQRQIYYSLDDKHTWNLWDQTTEITLENTGDRVYMYAMTDYIYNYDTNHFTTGTGTLACGGDILYMMNKHEGTMKNNQFSYFFSGMKNLVDASEIIFPDYTSEYCYYRMFYSCSGLKTPPKKLPAETLERNCYCTMFYMCTSLETAPELDFIYTAYQSCNGMFLGCKSLKEPPVFHNVDAQYGSFGTCFNGCSSLEYAPELPATELYESCYFEMFLDCPKLKTAPETLPATTLANDCYNEMFRGCSSLENMPTLPALEVPRNAYNYMFRDCVNLTGDVVLPATKIGYSGCYGMFLNTKITSAKLSVTEWYEPTSSDGRLAGPLRGMFQNCSELSSIEVSYTTWPTYDAAAGWVSGVAASGTFYKPAGLEEKYGTTYIPNGWEVLNADEFDAQPTN